jgi:long-chain acyl-CoA synthetase
MLLSRIIDNFYDRGAETAYVQPCGYRTVRWSYRQVAEGARSLSREMVERGISPGDRVCICGAGCAEWVVSFFASVLCGAVVVPMDRTASPEFVQRVCRQINPRLWIGSSEPQSVEPLLSTIKFSDFQEILVRHPCAPVTLPKRTAQDAVEIVFTSGTTADPKGVVISHRNILANLEPLEREIGKYLKYERIFHPLRFLNLLPLSHVFGQFLGLFVPQILGSTVVFQESLNPSDIIRTVKKEKVSVLITVPRILDAIRDKIERDLNSEILLNRFHHDFDSACGEHFVKRLWRFRRLHRQFGWKFWAFICGGASLSAESEEFWGRLGFAVVQGYGLTETTSLVSVNHPLKPGKGSIGKILAGREVKLSQDGEILVRGESIAGSYCRDKEAGLAPADEGWFHTGDLGFLDDGGNLYFKGRRKNVIVSPEGMNIYPEDLESALRRDHEIRDCAVVGVECSGNTEPCAVLILRCGDQDPAGIVGRANELLAEYQQIRRWLIWPEPDFPRTSTQKPQIGSIQQFANAQLREDAGRHTPDGIMADLIQRIAGRKPEWPSRNTSVSQDLNLSSIERVELLSALEDRFQVDIDESQFTAATTVRDLEQLLSRPAKKRSSFPCPGWPQSAPVAILRIIAYYLLTWPATLLMAYPKTQGRERLKSLTGPALFVSNHITSVDIGFILAALPRRFRHRLAVAMSGEMLGDLRNPGQEAGFFSRWLDKAGYGLVTALFNAFPLPQKSGFRESFRFAGESADRGYSILVFPEGTRTRTGDLNHFRAGIGILAKDLDLPVVPIRIDGLFELKKSRTLFAPPGTVRVAFGFPIRYEQGMDASSIALDLEEKIRNSIFKTGNCRERSF